MALYPVIMCGGAGTRLWPASRPSRPKQFIPLAGNRSLFQETVLRVAPLAENGGRLIVVGGVKHHAWISAQLAELDLDAQMLLEPEARDSAPAMAAAAAWVHRVDPDGVIAFVASDHHVPDAISFQRAVVESALGAKAGRIVTLGILPREPSSAYGYIRPMGEGLSAVGAFVEKPDKAVAARYIEDGYLWNSGNFIVSASVLLHELRTHAPGVEAAATAALGGGDQTTLVLGSAFGGAPKISIDYAVMEKTALASVLAVDFAWSDLGAWDAIAASGEGDTGAHILEDAEGCLVRAPDGVMVAALGVKNLAIVAENDAILVCDLSRAQDVKRIVERLRTASPRHLDFESPQPEALGAGARRFADWMRLQALPVWAAMGQFETGRFAEALRLDGRVVAMPHRARVQARQIYVYAEAGSLGWSGPWKRCVQDGLTSLYAQFLREDGLCRSLLDVDGSPIDETAMLYDQAFVLFALAKAKAAGIDDPTLEARAVRLRDSLLADAMPNGALRERGSHPFQSNAHMHLFESCLAWEAVGADNGWASLSDAIAELALSTFIDGQGGFLREFFDKNWRPAQGDDGRLVEPGHQFEWAWLLTRYGRARGDERVLTAARRLYANGRLGVLNRASVAVDAMNDDGSVRSTRARLWPQTEWLKAALILAENAHVGARAEYLADAAAALRALWLYLTPEGLWKDKRLASGGFIDEPAPASSFYHIMAAFGQLGDTCREVGVVDGADLKLA